jgi:hypothetical protein
LPERARSAIEVAKDIKAGIYPGGKKAPEKSQAIIEGLGNCFYPLIDKLDAPAASGHCERWTEGANLAFGFIESPPGHKTAEKKAVDSNDPADRRAAAELKAEAEARKADANVAEKKAEDAFRAPQETARQEKADALGLQKDVINADKEYKRADALANEAQAKADKSDNPADKEKAAELKNKAAKLKDKAYDILKRAQDVAKSPEERRNLDELRDASPEEQEKVAKQHEDLNSERYVTPKNSPQEGEVLVRRFKPDEIVPKRGLRLHIEAEANGRRDFRVKGWRLGLNPLIPNERLEEFVPIGPDLDVDVPLDLSFEYRGSDGMIHKDNAPFTLKGNLEIIPRIDIEKYKEIEGESKPKPTPAEKFNPKTGA